MQEFPENNIKSPQWLSIESPKNDVVIGIETAFIRNLENTPFPIRLETDKRKEIADMILNDVERYFEKYRSLSELEISDRYYFWERFIIPQPLIARPGEGYVLLTSDEVLSAVINGIDHIMINSHSGNPNFKPLISQSEEIINRLSERYDWATHSNFGFVSSNPAICGAGIIISAFCQVTATVMANRFDEIRKIIYAHGLGISSIWGSAMDTGTSFIKIYTKQLVGKSPLQLQDDISFVLDSVIEIERESRNYLMEKSSLVLKDKIYRACGIVSYANIIEQWEFPVLISSYRLGAALAILPISIRTVDKLSLIHI